MQSLSVYDVEHKRVVLGCGLGQGMALECHWHSIHYRARSTHFPYTNKNPPFRVVHLLVEHKGVEPLASTMPLWRATNCANAPRNGAYYNRCSWICKEVF